MGQVICSESGSSTVCQWCPCGDPHELGVTCGVRKQHCAGTECIPVEPVVPEAPVTSPVLSGAPTAKEVPVWEATPTRTGDEVYLSIKDLAAMLSVSVKVVQKWSYQHRLPGRVCLGGRCVRYSRRAIEQALSSGTLLQPARQKAARNNQESE